MRPAAGYVLLTEKLIIAGILRERTEQLFRTLQPENAERSKPLRTAARRAVIGTSLYRGRSTTAEHAAARPVCLCIANARSDRPLMADMQVIDCGGESSFVDLETRGLCLPDGRAILLGASRYPSSFSRSRPRRRQRRQAGPRTRTSGGRVSDVNEFYVIWRGSPSCQAPWGVKWQEPSCESLRESAGEREPRCGP